MQNKFLFENLYAGGVWKKNVFVKVCDQGLIEKFVVDSSVDPSDPDCEQVSGWALPGFINTHSHAFQYNMGGDVECKTAGAKDDDFWTWRENMYQWALGVSDEELYGIASTLYKEMLRNGYTHVCEFHYIHNNKNGEPANPVSKMAQILVSAAQDVGIGITIIPVFYALGGFGEPPQERQKRFIVNFEQYKDIVTELKDQVTVWSNVYVGGGIHSLRAATLEQIKEIFLFLGESPKHIHIAEQIGEVDSCLSFYGKRPVEWLLDNVSVNSEYTLVHATHLEKEEIRALAGTGAVVSICPSTEGNLGDGIFPLVEFLEHGGEFGIGSDSHIGLNPCEELRWLDYGQRLMLQKRTPLCDENNLDSGKLLFDKVLKAGRLSAGKSKGSPFDKGESLDVVVLDLNSPRISGKNPDKILSSFIYASDSTAISAVMTAGRWRYTKRKS